MPAWQPPIWWHVNDDSEIEALKAAKDDPGTIFTNDLRFQPAGRSFLTLLNIAAPQLFGQQFYASSFRFSNFAYPDVLDRLHAHEWFWSTSLGDHHRSFLTENDIKYLLIRRDMPFPREILSVPWVNVVLQNKDYYLLRVIEGYGETWLGPRAWPVADCCYCCRDRYQPNWPDSPAYVCSSTATPCLSKSFCFANKSNRTIG